MRILIDIGGTRTRIAASLDKHMISEAIVFDTPHTYEDALQALEENLKRVTGGNIESVVAGVPGVLDKEKTMLLRAPHLDDWISKPLKEDLRKLTQAPVRLENDAALAGLGEATFGAGKHQPIVAYLTISTGVGGVRIVEKKVDRAALGFEPGHQVIAVGEKGLELEDLIGGAFLEKRFGENFWDKMSASDWSMLENWLTIGIHNTILHWSPDIVVMGGKVGLNQNISIPNIESKLKNLLTIFPELPILAKATLGDQSGLYGALAITP